MKNAKVVSLLKLQVQERVTQYCIKNKLNRGSLLDWEWLIDGDGVSMSCLVIASSDFAMAGNVKTLTCVNGVIDIL